MPCKSNTSKRRRLFFQQSGRSWVKWTLCLRTYVSLGPPWSSDRNKSKLVSDIHTHGQAHQKNTQGSQRLRVGDQSVSQLWFLAWLGITWPVGSSFGVMIQRPCPPPRPKHVGAEEKTHNGVIDTTACGEDDNPAINTSACSPPLNNLSRDWACNIVRDILRNKHQINPFSDK